MATAHLVLARALPLAIALGLVLAPSAQAASVHSGLAATSRGAGSGFGVMRFGIHAFALVLLIGLLFVPSSVAAKDESETPTPASTEQGVDANPFFSNYDFAAVPSTVTVAPLGATQADPSAAQPTGSVHADDVKVVRERFNMSAIDPIVWYLPRRNGIWKTGIETPEGKRNEDPPNGTIARDTVFRIGKADESDAVNNNATKPRMVFFMPGGTIAPYGTLDDTGDLILSTNNQPQDDQPPNPDDFKNASSIPWGGKEVLAVKVENVTLQQQQVSIATDWETTIMRVHLVSLWYPITVYNTYENFADLPTRTVPTVQGGQANEFFNPGSDWDVQNVLEGKDLDGGDDHMDFDHVVVPENQDLTFDVPPHTSFFRLNGSVGIDSGEYSVKIVPQPALHQQRYDSRNTVIARATLYQTPLDPTVNYKVVVTPHQERLRVQSAIFWINNLDNSTTDGSGGQIYDDPGDTISGSGTDGSGKGETGGKKKSIIGPVVGGVVGGVGALALLFALMFCMRRRNNKKTHQHEPLTSHTSHASHATHTDPMADSRAQRLAPGYLTHNTRAGSNATEKHMLMSSEFESPTERQGRDSPLGPPVFATYTGPDWASQERSLHSSSRSSPTRPPPVSMPTAVPHSGQTSSSNASFHSLTPTVSARSPYIPTPAPVSQPKSNRSSRSGRSGRSKRGKRARAAADAQAAASLPGFVPRSRSKRNSGLPMQMSDTSDSDDTSDWDSDAQ